METAVLSTVDINAIKALNQPWVDACLARDWDTLLGLCTEDIRLMPPDEPLVSGREGVRSWLNNYPIIRAFTADIEDVEGHEHIAVGYGSFTITVELPGSPSPITVAGKFVDTFRKEADGRWRYANVTWNSNLPSPLRGAAPGAAASPLQARGLAPGLTVNDLAANMALFEGLGFTVGEKWEQDGKLNGVMLHAGNAMVGLAQDDWKKGKDRVKGVGMRLWVETTQNIDQVAARATAAGVTLSKEPYDTPWNSRALEVITPDGFALTISTPMT